jgi:lipopolysaccharide assembly protein A
MHFLKTLFWVLLAVFIALFASRNWFDVTLNLWGDLQADIKVPVLLGMMFLAGWLPTFLIYRARVWAMRRRIDANAAQPVPAVEPAAAEDAPVI